MGILNTGQVTSSGRGIAGLLNVWRRVHVLVDRDVPALFAAILRLR